MIVRQDQTFSSEFLSFKFNILMISYFSCGKSLFCEKLATLFTFTSLNTCLINRR